MTYAPTHEDCGRRHPIGTTCPPCGVTHDMDCDCGAVCPVCGSNAVFEPADADFGCVDCKARWWLNETGEATPTYTGSAD